MNIYALDSLIDPEFLEEYLSEYKNTGAFSKDNKDSVYNTGMEKFK